MVFGYNRIPIVSWLNTQATESLVHARAAGEMITHFGEHPSLGVGTLLETHQHDIENILRESMEFETTALQYYHHLLDLVVDRSILLEEYARQMIAEEEKHLSEVDKMLRKLG